MPLFVNSPSTDATDQMHVTMPADALLVKLDKKIFKKNYSVKSSTSWTSISSSTV